MSVCIALRDDYDSIQLRRRPNAVAIHVRFGGVGLGGGATA